MLVLGLTGGIASGKSTVSNELLNCGVPVVDADKIARQVVEPGRKAYHQVVDTFSEIVPDLVAPDGSLNRGELGKAVFGNPERLKKLNKIVHGAVKREIFRQLASAYLHGHRMVTMDVPLLFESGLHHFCGVILTVSTNKDVQLQRLILRNPELSEEDAHKRILSQMSRTERNCRADIIVENNGTLDELKDSVKGIVKQVTPSWFLTVCALVPPIGLVQALVGLLRRAWLDHSRKKHHLSKIH